MLASIDAPRPLAGLEHAQESATANQNRLKALQNFNRFPFAPASANLPDLTPKEVADALALALKRSGISFTKH